MYPLTLDLSKSTQRIVVCGDIHGCLDALTSLMKLIEFQSGKDTLVSCGDVIHKGPYSSACLQYIRSVGGYMVMGNHEAQQSRFRLRLKSGYDSCKMQKKDMLLSIEKTLTMDDIHMMETAPLVIRVPRGVVVHAGIYPALKGFPIEAYDKQQLDRFYQILRVRYLSPTGEFIQFGKESTRDRFWTEFYDGRFGHVFYGHQPYDTETPYCTSYATGMDLGAVFGGRLAAAIITDKIEYLSVPSEKYAEKFSKDGE